jgi:hypothetical protein
MVDWPVAAPATMAIAPAGAEPKAIVIVSDVVSATVPGEVATVIVGEVVTDAWRIVQVLPFESETELTAGGDAPPTATTRTTPSPEDVAPVTTSG